MHTVNQIKIKLLNYLHIRTLNGDLYDHLLFNESKEFFTNLTSTTRKKSPIIKSYG